MKPDGSSRNTQPAGLIAVKAKAKKQTSRGRKQDRARVAGGRDHEVRYTAKKTNRSAGT
jgi:hypothetical protein